MPSSTTAVSLHGSQLRPEFYPQSTVFAEAQAGATDEAKVTAGLAVAGAQGKKYLHVAESMRPYNENLVTDNPAVHRVRDWGRVDVWDVLAYGADELGSADSEANIHAAFAGRAASGLKGAATDFPYGTYKHSRPLWDDASRSRITAAYGTQLIPMTYRYGPQLVVQKDHANLAIPVGAALATGSGSSLNLTTNDFWLNLRDAATLDMDGLGAFCVEMFFKPNDTMTANWNLLASSGRMLPSDPTDMPGFEVFVVPAGGGLGQLWARANIAGVEKNLFPGGTSFTSGTTYHVALSYDGTTLRLFVNGVVVATTAASGTLTQNPEEDVTVGPNMLRVPDASIGNAAPTAQLDSIRVSNVARYTGTFTAPTAKHTSDANTLMLLNFDNQRGFMTRGETKDGDAWLYARQRGRSIPLIEEPEVSGFRFSGSGYVGLVTQEVLKPKYHHLTFAASRISALFEGNQFFWASKNITASSDDTAGCRYGLVIPILAMCDPGSISISGYRFGLVVLGALQTATGVFIELRQQSVFGLVVRGEATMSPEFSGLTINAENFVPGPPPASFRGSVALATSSQANAPVMVTLNGGQIETGGTVPPVLIDGVNGAVFNGTAYRCETAASVLKILGVPATPIKFINPIGIGGALPALTDVAGHAAVPEWVVT